MKLADRSPGLLIVLAGVVVYGTILIEIGMWMAASLALVFAVLGLVIATSVGIVHWFHALVSDGEDEPYAVMPAPAQAPVPAATAEPARPGRGVALPV